MIKSREFSKPCYTDKQQHQEKNVIAHKKQNLEYEIPLRSEIEFLFFLYEFNNEIPLSPPSYTLTKKIYSLWNKI